MPPTESPQGQPGLLSQVRPVTYQDIIQAQIDRINWLISFEYPFGPAVQALYALSLPYQDRWPDWKTSLWDQRPVTCKTDDRGGLVNDETGRPIPVPTLTDNLYAFELLIQLFQRARVLVPVRPVIPVRLPPLRTPPSESSSSVES